MILWLCPNVASPNEARAEEEQSRGFLAIHRGYRAVYERRLSPANMHFATWKFKALQCAITDMFMLVLQNKHNDHLTSRFRGR